MTDMKAEECLDVDDPEPKENGENHDGQNQLDMLSPDKGSKALVSILLEPVSTLEATQIDVAVIDSGAVSVNDEDVIEKNVFIAEREEVLIDNVLTDSGICHDVEKQNTVKFGEAEEKELETRNSILDQSQIDDAVIGVGDSGIDHDAEKQNVLFAEVKETRNPVLDQCQSDYAMGDSKVALQIGEIAKEEILNVEKCIEIEETGNQPIDLQTVEALDKPVLHNADSTFNLECPMIEKLNPNSDSEMKESTNNNGVGKVIDNVETDRESYLVGEPGTPIEGISKVVETHSKIPDFNTDQQEENVEDPLLPVNGRTDYVENGIVFPAGNVSESLLVNEALKEKQTDEVCDMEAEGKEEERTGTTTIVSMDLDGWQRFDVDENNLILSTVQSSAGQNVELWEQLLDIELDGMENNTGIPSTPHILEIEGPKSPLDQEKGFDLASPGNPFIDGVHRLSNFSATDEFFFDGNPPNATGSHGFEMPTALALGFVNHGDDRAVIGLPQQTIDSTTRQVNESGSKLQLHRSELSFSDSLVSPLDSVASFEAPFPVKHVHPDADQLVKAFMPTYGAGIPLISREDNGSKWVANFDSMAPPTQQISRSLSRSLSFPRLASDAVSGPSSLSTKEAESPQVASSALSPKLSPLVKKVVSKVRSLPVLSNASQGTSPKAKRDQKSIWAQCFCW